MGIIEPQRAPDLSIVRRPHGPPALSEDECVAAARKRLMALRRADGSWDFAAHLGTHFLSQYWLCLRWLDAAEPRLEPMEIVARLMATQRRDGSWRQLEERIDSPGELNATIFNYWFLKALLGSSSRGFSLRAEIEAALERARAFVITAGGVEGASLFTKTFLALFGEHPWGNLLRVPFALFLEGLPINYRDFSQWVIPHLLPIAYLRANRVTRRMGEAFSVRELWLDAPSSERSAENRAPDAIFDRFLIEKILDWQQPRGSWGGYTVSSLLSAMALKHAARAEFASRARMDAAISRGLEFVAGLYVGIGPGAYLGCLMDGHIWDTVLAANALLESAPDEATARADARASAAYVRSYQQESGGIPYGYDFEYAPDVDDTAEAILLWSSLKEAGDADRIASAAKWLRSLQNSDGGWGAFDRDNVGGPLLRWFARSYDDSVDLFDDSSADSTGHVLDALAAAGFMSRNSPEARKGVAYLRKTQDPELGAWEGRWGVNWIFGTTCALVGMTSAGVSPSDPAIERGIRFLLARQNEDGGFGETAASYKDRTLAGRGPSSPSQTAWVLWALCACGRGESDAAAKAAARLVVDYDPERGWQDPFATGTGHPGLLYMRYPSYAAAFPLLALARRRKSAGRTK